VTMRGLALQGRNKKHGCPAGVQYFVGDSADDPGLETGMTVTGKGNQAAAIF